MLHMYSIKYTTYHEGEKIDSMINDYIRYLMLDKEPKDKVINITWENVGKLKELQAEYRIPFLPIFIDQTRKGRIINREIKEWKTHSLNMQLVITYKLHTPSIKEVLNYGNGNKAIQYLKERGLGVNV